MHTNRVIVIGASAGGVEALTALVASLPPELPAPVFVVQHLSPHHVSQLPRILSMHGPLPAETPVDGTTFEPCRIYVAPPDCHLLIQGRKVLVKKGPKENRFRPSIDALFRSAAYSHGPRVIGIVLSGALHDGTAGLWHIKHMGGITVVQDPSEALHDSMPSNALEQVEIDHCLPVRKIGQLLQQLTQLPIVEKHIDKEDASRMEMEIGVAAGDDAFREGIMKIGPLSPFTCTECNGVLMQIREGHISRFRCHTGHAYSANALLAAAMERIEEHYG